MTQCATRDESGESHSGQQGAHQRRFQSEKTWSQRGGEVTYEQILYNFGTCIRLCLNLA